MVARWLARAVEVCDAFLQVGRFLAEKGDDCLLWGVWSVRGVGGKVEQGWKGGCPASAWAEFRGMRWTVALGISEGKGGGFCLDFRWIQEECWARSLWEGGEDLQESWVRLEGQFRVIFRRCSGFGLLSEEEAEVGRSLVVFWGGKGCSLARNSLESLSSLPGSSPLVFSSLSLLKLL